MSSETPKSESPKHHSTRSDLPKPKSIKNEASKNGVLDYYMADNEAHGADGPKNDSRTNGKSSSEKTVAVATAKHDLSIFGAPDAAMSRLNSLLSSTSDLSAILSTFSYMLRIQAYINAKVNFVETSIHDIMRCRAPHKLPSNPSSLTALSALLWRARLTLRLFGILPIYARARQLIVGPRPEQDRVLFATSLLQCSLYGVSQIMENVAFLSDSNILTDKWNAWLERKCGPGTKAIYTLAYRMWFLGVSCELIRGLRKMQLMWQRSIEAQAKLDGHQEVAKDHHERWHSELLVNLAWLPIGWQLSSWTEESVPGFNTSLHNAACLLSDWQTSQGLWAKTT